MLDSVRLQLQILGPSHQKDFSPNELDATLKYVSILTLNLKLNDKRKYAANKVDESANHYNKLFHMFKV